MRIHGHTAVSPVLVLLYPLIGWSNILIVILSSLFIDIDHIHLILKERAFTLSKIKNLIKHIYDEKINGRPNRAYVDIIYLFHTLEFNILLLIFSIWFSWLKFIMIGFIFHVVCDIIHHSKKKLPVMQWLFLYKSFFKKLDI